MKRLVFLAPDLEHAERVVESLHELTINDAAIHLLGRDHNALQQAHLHEATEMETSELESDFNWGIVAGGVLGLILGMVSYGAVIFDVEFGPIAILLLTVIGSLFGGLIGKNIGESTPNADLDKYQHALDAGQILLIVDVAVELLPEVYKQVRSHCPKALIESRHVFHDHPLAA